MVSPDAEFKTGKRSRSTSARPLVTIVTPSYNSAAFLEETILSVGRQSYPNIEYIVVDGGSTDGTVDIIEKHAGMVSRWVSEPDDGQADAIRKGFAMAGGDVLGWINSDDVYPDDAVERVVTALDRSGTDVVYGNRAIIDAQGGRVGERRLAPFLPFFSRRGILYGGFGIYQPASFWTRDLYERVGGVDASYYFCMDTDLITRFVQSGATFKHLSRELVQFRVHPDSKTATASDRAKVEWARISEGLPRRSAAYRATIRLTCRAWKLAYHLVDSQGRYPLRRALEKEYRFVP